MIRKEAIVAILGSPVAYYAAFAKVLGGVEAGIFASQFFYWYGKGHDPKGWIYKTQSEIEDETGLTRRNQETARKKLRSLGVLEERYAGMPAKLYYRINLDILFPLMNEWFSVEVLGVAANGAGQEQNNEPEEQTNEEPAAPATGVDSQVGGMRHPSMRESAIQGSANPPSKDVRMRQSSMSQPANQESANPPRMDGGSRRANTKTTTETTTKSTSQNTTETTTKTAPDAESEPDSPESDASPTAVAVGVDVSVPILIDSLPSWLVEEFRFFLGDERELNSADLASLAQLSEYPEHVVLQAFDAAQSFLADPTKGPIYSLGRWLVGTAKRKVEDEKQRGNGVSSPPQEPTFYLPEGIDDDAEAAEPELEKPLSEEELFWASVLAELSLRVPRDTYDNWVRDMHLLSRENDVYVIGLADERSKDWVENRFANTLRQTLSSRAGHAVTVRFEAGGRDD